jgi:hypothetical protein
MLELQPMHLKPKPLQNDTPAANVPSSFVHHVHDVVIFVNREAEEWELLLSLFPVSSVLASEEWEKSVINILEAVPSWDRSVFCLAREPKIFCSPTACAVTTRRSAFQLWPKMRSTSRPSCWSKMASSTHDASAASNAFWFSLEQLPFGSIGFLSCGALTSPRHKFIVNPKSFLISEVADLRPLSCPE